MQEASSSKMSKITSHLGIKRVILNNSESLKLHSIEMMA
jgi:hypothetical protein